MLLAVGLQERCDGVVPDPGKPWDYYYAMAYDRNILGFYALPPEHLENGELAGGQRPYAIA